MTPILLVLAILAPAWIAGTDFFGAGAVRPGVFGPAALPVFLLLAPPLYLAGHRLRSLRSEGLVRPAMTGALQTILGSVLLGGLVYAAFPAGPGSSSTDVRTAILLAMGLTLGEGFPSAGNERSRDPSSAAGRLLCFRQAHSAFTILFAAVALPFLLRAAPGGPLPSALGLGGRDSAVGLAWGIGIGWSTARFLPRDKASSWHAFLQLLAGTATAAGVAWAGGSPPLALIACGFLHGADSDKTPVLSTSPNGTIQLLSAAGILAVAGSTLEGPDVRHLLAPAAVLWFAQAVIRILILSGFGGLIFWLSPGNFPIRCLPALGWSCFPGPLAAGFLLVATAATSSARGGDRLLLAVALALLLQGTSAGPILAAAARNALAPSLRPRWARALAARVALRAQLDATERLRESGEIEEEAAIALRDAVGCAQRKLDGHIAELAAAQPSLRSERLSEAVRKVLDAGRAALARAREEGSIDEKAACEVEADLARRWRRAGAVSFEESLSGGWQLADHDFGPEDGARPGKPSRAPEV